MKFINIVAKVTRRDGKAPPPTCYPPKKGRVGWPAKKSRPQDINPTLATAGWPAFKQNKQKNKEMGCSSGRVGG